MADDPIQQILDDVLARGRGSRVTLRLTSALEVRYESLATGVPSIFSGAGIDLGDQPVPKRVVTGEQVVQDDCAGVYLELPQFHTMLAAYGTPGNPMTAPIVTPVQRDGGVIGALSLHVLGGTRAWSAEEQALCADACATIATLLP